MAPYDPFKTPGSPTAKTWQAILDLLRPGGWHTYPAIIAAAERAGANRKSAINRLDDAVRYGVVVKHGTQTPRTQADPRRYLLLPEHLAYKNARQWYRPGGGQCRGGTKGHSGEVAMYRVTGWKPQPVEMWICAAHIEPVSNKYTAERM